MRYLISINRAICKYGIFFIAVLFIQSCTSLKVSDSSSITEYQKSIPIVYYDEFGEKPDLLTENDIFYLTLKQQAEFKNYLNQIPNNNIPPRKIVANYLKRIVDGFNYHNDTFTAAESAESKQGNCLTLAILTTALARLANVEVDYELMHTPPVYQRVGNTIISSQHVRSTLYEPLPEGQSWTILKLRPVVKIDYFPTNGGYVRKRVSNAEFVSMFFRNKAAEAIIDKKFKDAFWLAVESLHYYKNNAHAINMLALIYDQLGYLNDADNLYQFGIENSDEKIELLSNYQKYLLRNGRMADAEELRNKFNVIDEPNPFVWLDLADASLADGELAEAKRYYEKVIEMAPYLHLAYSGLGRVEFLIGNLVKAKRAFAKASELAYEKDYLSLYQTKLTALESYAKNH